MIEGFRRQKKSYFVSDHANQTAILWLILESESDIFNSFSLDKSKDLDQRFTIMGHVLCDQTVVASTSPRKA